MSLRFTTDPTFLNTVANHPDVRPWLGTDGASYVDLGVLMRLPGALALENEHGGFVFTMTGDGAYEFHTQFLPEGRGRKGLEAAQAAAQIMFEEIGAPALQTYVPHENLGAKWLVRFVGFERTHEDAHNSYWCMTREAWEARARVRGG